MADVIKCQVTGCQFLVVGLFNTELMEGDAPVMTTSIQIYLCEKHKDIARDEVEILSEPLIEKIMKRYLTEEFDVSSLSALRDSMQRELDKDVMRHDMYRRETGK